MEAMLLCPVLRDKGNRVTWAGPLFIDSAGASLSALVLARRGIPVCRIRCVKGGEKLYRQGGPKLYHWTPRC